MDDNENEVVFRHQAVDNMHSSERKTILVRTPPSLGTTVFFVVGFLCFLIALVFVTKLPVYVKASGEILAGKEYHQIVVNQDDKNALRVNALPGQKVKAGEVVMVLEGRNKAATESEMNDIKLQLVDISTQRVQFAQNLEVSLDNIQRRVVDQASIIQQYKESLSIEARKLARYIRSAKSGVIQQHLLDEQYRAVSDIKSTIAIAQSELTELDILPVELRQAHTAQMQLLASQEKRLLLSMGTLRDGLELTSPCECIIENVLVAEGQPVSAGQSVLTLSQDNQQSSIQLHIPARAYKPIQVGHTLKVNVSAYPSAKYGSIVAKVTAASSTPVPGRLLTPVMSGDESYFIVQAKIQSVPKAMTLVTGMFVVSDVVVDAVTLYEMMWGED